MRCFRNFIVISLPGIIICLLSCTSKSDKIIEREKMKQVMLHLMMVDEYVNYYLTEDSLEQSRDSIRVQKYLDVLSLHKTDTIAFAKSLAYYKTNVKEFSQLVDSLNSFAIKEREKRFQPDSAPVSDTGSNVEDSLNR